MVEQVVKSHSLQQQEDTESNRHVRGEMSTRTTFQRSAKGNISIAECDPDGKFIIFENTHRNKVQQSLPTGTFSTSLLHRSSPLCSKRMTGKEAKISLTPTPPRE